MDLFTFTVSKAGPLLYVLFVLFDISQTQGGFKSPAHSSVLKLYLTAGLHMPVDASFTSEVFSLVFCWLKKEHIFKHLHQL